MFINKMKDLPQTIDLNTNNCQGTDAFVNYYYFIGKIKQILPRPGLYEFDSHHQN